MEAFRASSGNSAVQGHVLLFFYWGPGLGPEVDSSITNPGPITLASPETQLQAERGLSQRAEEIRGGILKLSLFLGVDLLRQRPWRNRSQVSRVLMWSLLFFGKVVGLIWLHELCLHVSYNDVAEYMLPQLLCE